MNAERKQILEMLAEGKITAQEAEILLDKIETGPASTTAEPLKPGEKRKIKYLRVHVDSSDGDKVNVRVPINLIRSGIKLGAILPEGASERIHASGLDLGSFAKMADEDLMEALAELQVDVDSEDGDIVRIYCE